MRVLRRSVGAIAADVAQAYSRSRTRVGCFLLGLVIPCLALAGCEAPPDPRRTNFEVTRENFHAKYNPKTGRLQKLDADLDKNGRMETFSYMDGSRVHRIEIDKDENGVIERWEHYDESNKLMKIGGSTRQDGIEDSWDFFDANGVYLKSELDENRDGIVESRYLYGADPAKPAGRVMLEAQLNIDAAGEPGQIVYYRADGSHIRTEVRRPLPKQPDTP